MIIDFTVENFLSIKDAATLSLVASPPYNIHPSHIIDSPDENIKLLKMVVLYGANASGKSNFLIALKALRSFILTSHTNEPDEHLKLMPFILDKGTKEEPTSFDINFFADNIRYNYSLTLVKEEIYNEELYYFPKGKKTKVFTRDLLENDEYEYSFGSLLKPKRIYEDIAFKTSNNILFISKAVQDNSKPLKVVYDWFSKILTEEPGINEVAEEIRESEDKKENLIRFLSNQDLDIFDVSVDVRLVAEELRQDPNVNISAELRARILEDLKDKKFLKITTYHRDNDGDLVPLPLGYESEGTRKLFSLSPIFEENEVSKVFFIDEISSDLHPLLVKNYVTSAQEQSNNQLICVTHDTHLIDPDIMRKDQIYFVEKGLNQATRIYSLLDFKARNDRENWELRYLSGRYGATPSLTNI